MSKKTSINIFSNPTVGAWVYNIIQIGSVIFILPLILKHFSTVEISFWLLLGTIAGFAMLTDLGFSNTLIRCVSLFMAGVKELPEDVTGQELNDQTNLGINFSGLLNLLKTLKKVYYYITFGCLILIIVFGFALCFNLFSLTDDKPNLLWAFILTCTYSTISVATSMWTSYAQGLGMIFKINYTKIFTGSLKLFLLIILLLFNLKLWTLTVVLLVEALINYFIARKIVFEFFEHSMQNFDFKVYKYDKFIFKVLWKPTWRMAGIKLGGYLINQGNAIVIAQLPNPTIIASFMFTKRILEFLTAMSTVPFNVNIHNIYTRFVSDNTDTFIKYVSSLLFLSLFIYVSGAFSIGLFGNTLLQIAHIHSFLLGSPAFALLALTLFLEMHHSMHAGIYMSTNKVPFLIPAVVSGVLILGLGFLFISKINVTGLIIIQLSVQLALNNWYPVYLSLRLMKWPFFKYIYQMPTYGISGLRSLISKS